MRRRTRGDAGQSTILIVGFATVIAVLVAVVVDASAAFLERQDLDSLADGAALAGADRAAEGTEVYSGGLGTDDLELSLGEARQGVADYLRATGAYADHAGLTARVSVVDDAVVVRLTSRVDLPLTVPGAPSTASVSSTGSAVVRPE